MDTDALFSTSGTATILVKVLVFYGYMVILLRASGKRTTMSMTSFDFVSTIAMATIIGSTILQSSISLMQGLVAVTALVALQWVAGLLSAQSTTVRSLIISAPTILFKDGEFVDRNLTTQRISREQIMQKVRAAGHGGTETVSMIVMESAGTISVVEKEKTRGEVEVEQ